MRHLGHLPLHPGDGVIGDMTLCGLCMKPIQMLYHDDGSAGTFWWHLETCARGTEHGAVPHDCFSATVLEGFGGVV